MKTNRCPICLSNYYSIHRSQEVCEGHQSWIVTRCYLCGRACFSDCAGACIDCCLDQERTLVGGGIDRRAILRQYGLEGYD